MFFTETGTVAVKVLSPTGSVFVPAPVTVTPGQLFASAEIFIDEVEKGTVKE
jgi:hypothetical protein